MLRNFFVIFSLATLSLLAIACTRSLVKNPERLSFEEKTFLIHGGEIVYNQKGEEPIIIPIAELGGWWVISNGNLFKLMTKAQAFDDGICAKSPAKD